MLFRRLSIWQDAVTAEVTLNLLSGIYDDGDSMCANCIAGYASEFLNNVNNQTLRNQLSVKQQQHDQGGQNQKSNPKKPKKKS